MHRLIREKALNFFQQHAAQIFFAAVLLNIFASKMVSAQSLSDECVNPSFNDEDLQNEMLSLAGCGNLTLVNKLDGQTKALILGEWHTERDLLLKCGVVILNYMSQTFSISSRDVTFYAEGSYSTDSLKEDREALCRDALTAPICKMSGDARFWDNKTLHAEKLILENKAFSLPVYEAILAFQRKNKFSDAVMYNLFSNENHPRRKKLMSSMMDISMSDYKNKTKIIYDAFAFLAKLSKDAIPLENLVVFIFEIFSRSAGLIVVPDESAESLKARMLTSKKIYDIDVRRDDYFFKQLKTAITRNRFSLFIAGNFHAFGIRERLTKEPHDQVAVVTMKPFKQLHHDAIEYHRVMKDLYAPS